MFSRILDFPATEQVLGIIAIVTTFLGVYLAIGAKSHYDGDVVVTEKLDGGMRYSLNLNGDPEELANEQEISFRVIRNSEKIEPEFYPELDPEEDPPA